MSGNEPAETTILEQSEQSARYKIGDKVRFVDEDCMVIGVTTTRTGRPHTFCRLKQQVEIDRPEKDESKAVKKDRRAKILLVQKADTAARRVNRASRREGISGDAAARS